MKTKLTKTIMSSLSFTCALGCLVAAIAMGTSATGGGSATTGAAADAQVCSVDKLRGLYLWTFDGYTSLGGILLPKAVMQGLQFNGDGTMYQYLRHSEHRGHDYHRRHRRGRNLYGRSRLHGNTVNHQRPKL